MESRRRTVHIKWTWGRSLYLIRLDRQPIRVMQPSWSEQKEGCVFYFEWPPDDKIKTFVTKSREIVIERNGRELASVVPVSEQLMTIAHRHTVGVLVAEIHACDIKLKLVCDVTCNFFANRFRILTGDGVRLCYWRRTSGWGGLGAKLLISKRVHPELVPMILAIATSMLKDSGED